MVPDESIREVTDQIQLSTVRSTVHFVLHSSLLFQTVGLYLSFSQVTLHVSLVCGFHGPALFVVSSTG
jgi:hypothetical protein